MPTARTASPGRLGTFAGVFTPSVLTILGLILFRRLGYVVGAGGMGQALVILLIAHAISILTSASLSAIATNLHVKGGGDYYLISRSLGVEFGGALGVVLFLAQSISVAFYCIGFGEAIAALLPGDASIGAQGLAVMAALFLFVFAWLGADWATRLQYVVMAALGSGLLAFFIGGLAEFSWARVEANWTPAPGAGLDFWVLFALFFPAVTGFTQGVSMSGDLENPGRSLPGGTFAAVFVSLAVYLGATLVFAGSATGESLTADYEAMSRVAVLPVLITVGIVAATLSSALASFMGAPRILQALAQDRVFPPLLPFAVGQGETNNPRRGVLLTLAIALVFCAAGGVDFIAPVVSMFFLISYGLLNYATALEARANSPSFRPRFRWFHYRASLLGALACLGVMLMINPWASAIALVFMFALYQYIERLAAPSRWAAGRRDHYFHSVRTNLRAMAEEPVHPRSWRPHLLVFSDAPARRRGLVEFASWIEGGAGVTTVVRLIEGDGDELAELCRSEQKALEDDIEKQELEAYALVVAAPNLTTAAQTVIQAHGIGPLRPNCVLINWLGHHEADAGGAKAAQERATGEGEGEVEGEGVAERPEEEAPDDELKEHIFVRHLRAASRLGVNVIVLDALEKELAAVEAVPAHQRRIDVWWTDDETGRLSLLLAYMMTRSDEWAGATIRLLARGSRGRQDKGRERLRETLDDIRIEAEVLTISDLTREKLVQRSRDASLVFLPLRLRRQRAMDLFGKPVEDLVADLPMLALVSAVQDITLDAGPEEGEVSQLAALTDAVKDARRALRKAEARSEKAGKEQEAARVAGEKVQAAKKGPAASEEERARELEKSREAAARLKETRRELRQAEGEARKLRNALQTAEDRLREAGGEPVPAEKRSKTPPEPSSENSTETPPDTDASAEAPPKA
ncbi:MAG: amino acid permease [Planctomycetota bacterium]|jgi:amino acid transporter